MLSEFLDDKQKVRDEADREMLRSLLKDELF
jgi:hypothetical protein